MFPRFSATFQKSAENRKKSLITSRSIRNRLPIIGTYIVKLEIDDIEYYSKLLL